MSESDAVVAIEPGVPNVPGGLWHPVEGDETGRLLRGRQMRDQERDTLIQESIGILARSTDPADRAPSRRAGLIVGGVQSGKTVSFTTVTALARDNGYQLVIIIAGTKDNLLEQSRDRLAEDLGLGDSDAHYRWVHHRSPRPDRDDAARLAADIRQALDSGSDPDDVATVLVTVMKNHTHMSNTAKVLRQLGDLIDMNQVTALVIDDEADQATPNTRRTGESATYRNLREIRDALPRHTLLEYTATPQAPLLVSIADEISPDFTCVLTPGLDYTGGRFFFEEHADTFLEIIPPGDLASLTNPALGPADSLLRALAVFFVGATAAQVDRTRRASQRSMLVHPSHATLPHAAFTQWIEAARRTWSAALQGDGSDQDDLIADWLQPAYHDLALSVDDLPAWDDVLPRLPNVIDRTRVEEVNTRGGRARPIDWSSAYSWILIGGAMMDRGFTVEGLTVTYMPRGTGVGNADSVQQRARFFGYKRSYAGYCRAWLEADVADAFLSYVQHEEAMRRELAAVEATGESLRDWRRRFLLDPNLRPTRQSVIDLPIARFELDDRWLQQWRVSLPPQGDDVVARNEEAVTAFCNGLEFSVDVGRSGSTAIETHERAECSLGYLYRHLLVEVSMVEEDHPGFLGLLLSIENYLEDRGDPGAVVYRMSSGSSRVRALDGNSPKIKSLFQGRSRDRSYPGDRSVRDDERLTVQLHYLDIQSDTNPPQTVVSGVPFLAIWVPSALGLEAAIVQR